MIRVHKKARSKLFNPRESPHPTIPEHALKDERRTLRIDVRDSEDWKDHKDNWRTGNDEIAFKGPKWTGRTVFEKRTREQYLSAPSIHTCSLTTILVGQRFFIGRISSAGGRVGHVNHKKEKGAGNKE